MKQWFKLFLFLMLLISQQVYAESLKPFVGASKIEIEKAYVGQPMVLAFWSLDCPYCMDELNVVADLVKKHPKIKLVLVNTDGLTASQEVVKALNKMRLPQVYEAWQFAEADEDRLRYSVDKNWYGELPRTYYYENSHQVKAISGSPDLIWLKNWTSKF